MTSKWPDTQVRREIHEFNREFLELVREHPGGGPAYGLEAQVLQRLRAMSPIELQAIAETPCLLVGFPVPPLRVAARRVAEPPLPVVRAAEAQAARLFAASLLTWLWHTARQDRLLAALCIGPGSQAVEKLRGAAFRDLQRMAAGAAECLEARFCQHPRLWPDLVRAASRRDPHVLMATRLSIIQFTLVQRVAAPLPIVVSSPQAGTMPRHARPVGSPAHQGLFQRGPRAGRH